MKAYTPPVVPLVVFNDIKQLPLVNKLLNLAKKRAQERFMYQKVMTTEEFLLHQGDRFPFSLQSVDMDSEKGKIVMVPDAIQQRDLPRARPGSKYSNANNGPQTIHLLTSPFLLRPCSKPNALGNDGEIVEGKPIKDGDQKRTVLTSAYPPFSCLVSPKAPKDKPYNVEMDRLIDVTLWFRRSVCDLLCKEENTELVGSELGNANICLMEMRVACAEVDEKYPDGGRAAYEQKFPLYDKFMSTCCQPVIKKPKSSADAQEPAAPKTAAEKLKAMREAKAAEIAKFSGTEYLTFKSRVGFPRKFDDTKRKPEFVHPNPFIRARIDQINASCNGSFAYTSPVIYYLNPATQSWDQMTSEQADSLAFFDQRKLIVSELFGYQFSPKGKPGSSQVRVNGLTLFVWGIAGSHVPDSFAGGMSMTGEKADDSEVLEYLRAQKTTTDTPSEEVDQFSHEPSTGPFEPVKRAIEAITGAYGSLEGSSSSDPGLRKKPRAEPTSAFYDEDDLVNDD